MAQPIVVITGADTPTGLTTVRSLRGHPVECWGVAEEINAASCKSRYWRLIEILQGSPADQVRCLVELGCKAFRKSGKKPLLLFSQDEWVLRASYHRDMLNEAFTMVIPDHQRLVRLMDKTLFYEWAVRRNYPLPLSVKADNKDDLCHAASSLHPPFVVKPMVRSKKWDDVYVNRKIIKCTDSKDVTRLQENAESLLELSSSYILQEWIAGNDEGVVFCLLCADEDGQMLDVFAGKKLWQWPPLEGSTAVCTNFVCPEIESISIDLMMNAGFKGLGSLEFKFNNNCRKYQITEPTIGRNDYQSFIAVCAGHNLTGKLVESVFSMPAIKKNHSKNAVWVDELAAYERARVEKRGFLKLLSWMVRNVLSRKCFLFTDFRDMKPALARMRELL